MTFGDTSLPLILAAFGAATLVVVVCGVLITRAADVLADRTGLGEAVVGGTLLGAATSLSGSVVSVTAALDGRASLAFSNGVGGIAAQTAFLALADVVYRRANLEHASAELANILQASLLGMMLGLVVMASMGPEMAVLGVHPVTLALPVAYVLGVRAASRVRERPMWRPVRTAETRDDLPEDEDGTAPSTARIVLRFVVLAGALGLAGFVISRAGGEIATRTGLSDSVAGALMTAVATSLPELITTVAAVRAGAAQLAVGGIIGGNAFDVLFLSASDLAFREGSLYQAVGPADLFWVAVGITMTAVLSLGLLVRQKSGPGGIGFESLLILAIYLGAVVLQTAF